METIVVKKDQLKSSPLHVEGYKYNVQSLDGCMWMAATTDVTIPIGSSEMNTLMVEMRHTAHDLRATLDHILQGGDPMMATHNSQEEGISFLSEHEADIVAVGDKPEDSNNYMYLAENLRVPRNLYEHVGEIADFKKYTGALLMMLFDRETLATHSLQGRRNAMSGEECPKPQLPPEILRSIIEHVAVKFGVDRSQIKTAIRTKLNNEDKLLKKRMGLVKVEHKADNASI